MFGPPARAGPAQRANPALWRLISGARMNRISQHDSFHIRGSIKFGNDFYKNDN